MNHISVWRTTYLNDLCRRRQLPTPLQIAPLLKPSQQLLLALHHNLLTLPHTALSTDRIPRLYAPSLLRRIVTLEKSRAVLLERVGRHTLHAEDLDLQTLAVRQGILDLRQRLLVHLVQVDGETAGSVEAAAAAIAFEVLRLLMGDEELEVFKVAFAYKIVSYTLTHKD